MDIKGLDRDKFEGLRDLVTISEESITPYPIWNLPADSLKQHPYVGNYETACAIVLYRQNNPPVLCTVEALESSGIISCENATSLPDAGLCLHKADCLQCAGNCLAWTGRPEHVRIVICGRCPQEYFPRFLM